MLESVGIIGSVRSAKTKKQRGTTKMKKAILKSVSIILCIAMLVCMGAVGAGAEQRITDCNGECGNPPSIIVPGLGQGNTWVLDENGDYVLDDNGNKVTSFPAYIQLPKLIAQLAVPLILSLLLQSDIGLSEAAAKAIDSAFGINKCDETAHLSDRVTTEKYPYPVSECEDFEREEIYSHVPFNKYEHDQPLDHFYYFTYNSFDNHIDLVKELYDYIQMVKQQTGHDKVTLIPLSQGGTLMSGLLEYYPDITDSIHKVIYVVPAIDGSTIIGDVFNGRVTFTDPAYLLNGFLGNSGLLDSETAALIEVVARILPDEVLGAVLESAVDVLVGDIMTMSTSMWALCPSGDYPTAAEKYLSDRPEIKKQTDKYYKAQLNAHKNIQAMVDKGIQVFCIAEYDINMINVGESWNTQNADYIIQLDSTTMGATAAKVGETLPENYVQKNTVCKDPTHNHISPDRVVDASTGLLPDTTFYFDGQKHERTANNDVILKLALELICRDDVTDVYSSPDFPQFNVGREPQNLLTLMEQAKQMDKSALTDADKAELEKAFADAEEMLDDTVVVAGELEEMEARFTSLLVKAGAMEEQKEINLPIFSTISKLLNDNFGTDGFSEIIIGLTLGFLKTVLGDFIKK